MNIRFFITSAVFLMACSGNEERLLNKPPVSKIIFSDGIDRILLSGQNSTDAEGNVLSYQWSTPSDKIILMNSTSSSAYFMIPAGTDEKTVDISLTVSDGTSQNTKLESLTVPGLTQLRSYGLGKNLTKEKSNDCLYNWYIDQSTTGAFALMNCGPSSATMAAKWYNASFTGTVEDARNYCHPDGSGFYTSDIIKYFSHINMSYRSVNLDNMDQLKKEIDFNNIAILAMDMGVLRFNNTPEQRCDLFYSAYFGFYHLIVIKGYKEVDGELFFEAYDPYSNAQRYLDGTLKGIDRYYRGEDVYNSTHAMGEAALIISRN